MNLRYLIVIERTATGFISYSPALDGCVVTGATRYEVEQNMHDAIEFHLAVMHPEGYSVPQPSAYSTYVDIAV